ncbi:anti-sigma factor [Alcaligenaceae bacterium]|nr:anti-sigma factor [Alcaligenaceae bacterium]
MSNTTPQNDILLAEYTLGLLNARETQQAHALLGRSDDAVATALDWEESLLTLTDLLAPVDPSPLVLQRIQTSLGHDTTPPPSALYRKVAGAPTRHAAPSGPVSQAQAPATASVQAPPETPTMPAPAVTATVPVATAAASASKGSARTAPDPAAATAATMAAKPASSSAPAQSPPRDIPERTGNAGRTKKDGNIWFWRLSTVVFAGIALALGLAPAKPSAPPVTILEVAPTQAAVLQAPGHSSTPAWVVTIDHQQNVHMVPQANTDVPPDASVQLWTHTASMPQPRSLGLIDPNRPVTVPAELMGSVSAGQIFEMTLEPQGGSRAADPSGPVLYIGRVVALGAAPAAVNTPPR